MTPTRTSRHSPALSLILCSRNDSYMGNSRWRLQTALNFVAKNVLELGLEGDVEILVTDWGSSEPLREVLELSRAAARITSFIRVPPATAREVQRDSPFAEVIALNVAARRANGEYIGRIDQDTLVGKRFLSTFFEIRDGRRDPVGRLAMGFSNVKMVSYRFSVRCPSLASVELFVRWFGRSLPTENARSRSPYYMAGVGIWLLHRDLWYESGGYDERMIHMNTMETNMVLRLLPRHELVDLGALTQHDFYHLEHYHPWEPRRSSAHRRVNPDLPFLEPDALNPNGGGWGMAERTLEWLPARGITAETAARTGSSVLLSFLGLMLGILPAMTYDRIGLFVRRQVFRLQRLGRALLAR